jgi:hypothetical protein
VRKEKQLAGLSPREVERKRQRDQALNAKELAVLVDVSYPIVLGWFRLPRFPAVGNFVFYSDFVHWRRTRLEDAAGAKESKAAEPVPPAVEPPLRRQGGYSHQAERILRLAAGD